MNYCLCREISRVTYSSVPNNCTFISGKVCFLTLIEAKRQTLSEINLQGQFVVKGGKFKLSAQGKNLAPFVGNETIVKIPSEIKLPLDGQ